MSRVRVQLHTPSGWQRLAQGSYLLGRSDACEIVLDSSRASRKHARLDVTEDGAALEDLGSANGTYVNGSKLSGAQALAHGDFIVIGDLGLELSIESLEESADGAKAPEPHAEQAPGGPYLPPTSRVSAGEVLAAVADRALDQGHPEQAEKTLEQWLSRLGSDVRAGGKREAAEVMVAARQALRLANALGSQRWVDFTLDLLGYAAQVPSRETLEALEKAVDHAGAGRASLERFAERMRTLPDSPEQQQASVASSRWLALRG